MSGLIEQPRYSCALAAQQSVLGIPRALPIIHCGPGCTEKTFLCTSAAAGNQGEGYGGGGQVASTNSGQKEVIFGGESKLRKLIENSIKVLNAELFVVLAGCTSGIVGDDVVSVSKDFAAKGFPVVGAETSGFKGNNYYGHELIVNSIIEQFVDRDKPEPKVEKGLVNVFASVPYQNMFWRADLEEIKRLIGLVGLKVNILFGYESKGVSEWENIPNAEHNIVLSPWIGLSTAELLKKKYGTPFLHYPNLPVGGAATSRFLRTLAEYAGLDKTRVEEVIADEERRFYRYIVSFSDYASDNRINLPEELYIIADSSYALGTADFLVNEIGFEPRGIYITDNPKEKADAERIIEAAGKLEVPLNDKVLLEKDGGRIQAHIREDLGGSKNAVILGSSWEAKLAGDTNNLLVHLSIPTIDDVVLNRSFVGYNGGLRLVEEIYAGIYHRGRVSQTSLIVS